MIDNHSYQHSYEVQEIIGKAPSWMVRWGISVLFGSAAILLALSLLITYPDTARYPVSIMSDITPQYVLQSPNEMIVFTHPEGKINRKDTIEITRNSNGENHTIIAEYAGIFVPVKQIRKEPGDTVAIIIPRQTGYSFSGSLPAGLLKSGSASIPVSLLVKTNNFTGEINTLHGYLTSMTPAINGICSYMGNLDPVSNRQLTNENAFTSSCKGILEIKLSEKSLFSAFIKKTFGF